MFIITSKENSEIVAYGNRLDYMVNGYPRLIEENIAFPMEMVDVFEVATISNDIKPRKFCYSEELGFYENPNYEEPNEYGLPSEMYEEIISKGYEQAILDMLELEEESEE